MFRKFPRFHYCKQLTIGNLWRESELWTREYGVVEQEVAVMFANVQFAVERIKANFIYDFTPLHTCRAECWTQIFIR
jgi:hypothetical protein